MAHFRKSKNESKIGAQITYMLGTFHNKKVKI